MSEVDPGSVSRLLEVLREIDAEDLALTWPIADEIRAIAQRNGRPGCYALLVVFAEMYEAQKGAMS